MRLIKVQDFLNNKGWTFQYTEEEEMGSIDFEYKGIGYHIWEFCEQGYGAESNVRDGGKQEDFCEDYENEIVKIMGEWR